MAEEPKANLPRLSSVLEKLHIGHLLENFQREKVTVDQICKLSFKQMECLGINQARRVDSVEGGSFICWEVFFSAGANTSAEGASL